MRYRHLVLRSPCWPWHWRGRRLLAWRQRQAKHEVLPSSATERDERRSLLVRPDAAPSSASINGQVTFHGIWTCP